MQNFNLLRELETSARPVLAEARYFGHHRRAAAFREYILAGGNYDVILCERGIRTFRKTIRATPWTFRPYR